MNITLTPEIENALIETAQKQGTTPELLALDALREKFVALPADGTPQASLADYLSDHIGVISSSEYVPGGASMSEDCGKKFATGLIQKQRQAKQ